VFICAGARLLGDRPERGGWLVNNVGAFAGVTCDAAVLTSDSRVNVGDSFVNALWLLANVYKLPAAMLLVETRQVTQHNQLPRVAKVRVRVCTLVYYCDFF
jgi:hypothetical protein